MSNQPRAQVQRFALAMEAELRANDHKGGWHACTLSWLLRRLRVEVNELERAIKHKQRVGAEVLSEAADVANFAMMIADNCGALPALPVAVQRFRKRPVEVSAVRYCGPAHVLADATVRPALPDGVTWKKPEPGALVLWPVIETLEGDMRVSNGDWIVTGIKGERYPVKPEIFAETYDTLPGE